MSITKLQYFIYVTYNIIRSIMYLAVSRTDEVSVKDPATLANYSPNTS